MTVMTSGAHATPGDSQTSPSASRNKPPNSRGDSDRERLSDRPEGGKQLDTENPWPGLDAFEESAQEFFFGRDSETAILLRTVIDAPVTILYGRSGLGKTSLL